MKKGLNEKTIKKYLSFLMDLKETIETNPKINTSLVVQAHRVSYDVVTILKKTKVLIFDQSRGWRWQGSVPNTDMVYKIYLMRENAKQERMQKIKNQLNLDFEKQRKKRTNLHKGSSNSWNKYSEIAKEKVNEQVLMDQWKQKIENSVKESIKNQTAIPIQNRINSTEKEVKIVNLDPPKKTWELKIFGITLIKINR